METNNKLWTKDFIMATFTAFFAAVVFYTTVTTFAGYALATYEVNESVAGFVAGVFILGSAFGRLYAGRFVELVGRRKMMLIGGLLFFTIGLGYIATPPLAVFFVIRFFHGASFGIFHTSIMTIVTGVIPANRRGEGLGIFSLGFVLSVAVGPAGGLLIINLFSYDILMIYCSIIALMALLFSIFLHVEVPNFTEEEKANLRGIHSIGDLFEKKALPMASMIIILSMCYLSITSFLETYTTELGLDNTVSMFFILNAIVIVVVRPLAGKLLDRKGDNFAMYPSLVFFSICLFVLSFADTSIDLMIVSVLMACGYGNALIMGQVIAINSSPTHRVGTATSTYFVFCDFGQGVGPLIYGLIATQQGFRTMYFVAGIVSIICIFIYFMLHGRKASRKKT